jgi:hypothetical protein
MERNKTNHICVFKTGKLYEHDMARNALTENNIPHYNETETVSGLRLAMPFPPEMAPGRFYSILVPKNAVEDAKSILSELPIDVTTDPDIWHFNPSEKAKRIWKIFIIILISLAFSLMIMKFLNR